MGNLIAKIAPYSQLSQHCPPKSIFDPARDIGDLTGKVIIVTGGNSGIGYHTVKHLLLKNAKVYLAARSSKKSQDSLKRLEKDTEGKGAVFLQLDLADLQSVRNAAEEFLKKEQRLDVLINNAGVMIPPTEQFTEQGYDLQFGTNVMGHYLFTKLLLPAMERSHAHHGAKARIINVSSAAHELAPGATGIDYRVLKGGAERDATLKTWGSLKANWTLYGASKLATVMFSNILIKNHGDFVISCALNPGSIRTDLQKHLPGWQLRILDIMLYSPECGASTQLWAATLANPEVINGRFLIPWARLGKCDSRAANEKIQTELFEWLEAQVKDI